MTLKRPDLSQANPAVLAYIQALEAELEELRQGSNHRAASVDRAVPPLEPNEPPTPLNVITVSRSGLAKRTPRHLYTRQHRGGMGIFDLDVGDDDPPVHLLVADQSQDLLLVTSQGRVFRLPVEQLAAAPVRSRGESLPDKVPLNEAERLALVLPHRREGYLTLVTDQAHVRRFRYHYFRDDMAPGTLLYDVRLHGRPLTAAWTSGNDDLFLATRLGKAIRFPENKVTTMGVTGLRLDQGDRVVGVAGVNDKSSILLLSADGRGTVRRMIGFSANKAPGAGGKVAIKADEISAMTSVGKKDDVFIISRLSKIVRFAAEEIPAKEGVVQGVNCMGLRGDEVAAVTASG
jgi:DNA gyrase subunit A